VASFEAVSGVHGMLRPGQRAGKVDDSVRDASAGESTDAGGPADAGPGRALSPRRVAFWSGPADTCTDGRSQQVASRMQSERRRSGNDVMEGEQWAKRAKGGS